MSAPASNAPGMRLRGRYGRVRGRGRGVAARPMAPVPMASEPMAATDTAPVSAEPLPSVAFEA
eukprot:8557262-Alexandrium_andersonii.AAC.1